MEQVAADDAFLQKCLDWIPSRHLIPLTDEEKEAQWRKSAQKSAFTVNKKNLRTSVVGAAEAPTGRAEKKRARLGESNADRVRLAAQRAQEAEAATRRAALANETLVRPAATRASDVGELRERMAERILELRKKNGVAGSRAERDKLLPSKADRKRLKRAAAAAGTASPAPAANESKLTFGAIKGVADDDADEGQRSAATSALSTKSIFNVKKLIKKAEASQERLAKLKEDGRTDLVEEQQWATAQKKAQGEKMRDDPRKLKQALKRLESKKKKAGEAWSERKAAADDAKKERIEARESNIEQRKKHKKKKHRPGFEGAATGGSKQA